MPDEDKTFSGSSFGFENLTSHADTIKSPVFSKKICNIQMSLIADLTLHLFFLSTHNLMLKQMIIIVITVRVKKKKKCQNENAHIVIDECTLVSLLLN